MRLFQNFNSIKVRLKLPQTEKLHQKISNFNSIKVRLKLLLQTEERRLLTDFNSIKVRLKLIMRVANGVITDFNSIKVRLKLAYRVDKRHSLFLFQFHKGTIKTTFFVNNKSN